MEEEFERAQALLTRYEDELLDMLPAEAEIFDAHVHLGHDIDGQIGVYEELERLNDMAGVSRCFMFCMDEPDRHPAFREPNDRTLEYARRSEGRLVPFVRLDLSDPGFVPVLSDDDLAAHAVWSVPRSAVRDVWVGGRQVVRDGECLTIDVAEASRRVQSAAARLAQ